MNSQYPVTASIIYGHHPMQIIGKKMTDLRGCLLFNLTLSWFKKERCENTRKVIHNGKKRFLDVLRCFLRNINNQLFVSYEMNLHFLFHMKGHQNQNVSHPVLFLLAESWGFKIWQQEIIQWDGKQHKKVSQNWAGTSTGITRLWKEVKK